MSERQTNKRGRPHGTRKADPTKDRSDHDAARGKKMLTLRDLIRQIPSEEMLDQYFQTVQHESDRGAAVMAAALTERALEDHVRSRLHDPGDGTAETWFEGINAPFGTFSAKISLARALTIVDADVEQKLVVIKNVRNLFAHAMIPLNFTDPTVVAECNALIPEEANPEIPTRMVFAASCLTIARLLGMTAIFRTDLGSVAGNGQGPLK